MTFCSLGLTAMRKHDLLMMVSHYVFSSVHDFIIYCLCQFVYSDFDCASPECTRVYPLQFVCVIG